MLEYQQDLMRIVEIAMNDFNQKEKYLIKNDLSERCICARFAMYLSKALIQTRYRDYDVDVEYNRGTHGKEFTVKSIEQKPIVVDLIVHKRGYDIKNGFNNLICMEMKKSTNRRGCKDDEIRLNKMVDYRYGFNYKIAIMVLINMPEQQLEIKNVFTF